MAVVVRALVAGAVLAVILEEGIEAVRRLRDDGAPRRLVGRPREGGDEDVLGAPGRPVVHRLVAIAHPPEVPVEIGAGDARRDLVVDAPRRSRDRRHRASRRGARPTTASCAPVSAANRSITGRAGSGRGSWRPSRTCALCAGSCQPLSSQTETMPSISASTKRPLPSTASASASALICRRRREIGGLVVDAVAGPREGAIGVGGEGRPWRGKRGLAPGDQSRF